MPRMRVNDAEETPDVSLLLRSSVKALAEDPKEARARFRAAARANAEPCSSCGKVIVHRQGLGWCQDHEMPEEGPHGLRVKFTRRAKSRGWRVAHAGKGWVGDRETGVGQFVTQMLKSWPDLTLIKAGHHLIFVELKREDGEFEEGQVELLQLLNRTGNFAIVIRPSDLRTGRVNAILDEGAPL